MVLSREEKENMVVDFYYNKSYSYRQLTRELRMFPNQIREIIKRHEPKNDAIANKKKVLSISSQAYKLFSEGKNNVQVAIKLDLPQEKITQFRMEYWRLRNQDKLETLYVATRGKVSDLWKLYRELIVEGGMNLEDVASVIRTGLLDQLSKLYKELVIKRGISLEEVAAVVDVNLNILPDMERRLDQTSRALARKEVDLEYLEEEEKRRRNRIVTLSPSSYRYLESKENPADNTFPHHSYPSPTPSSLPYWPPRRSYE